MSTNHEHLLNILTNIDGEERPEIKTFTDNVKYQLSSEAFESTLPPTSIAELYKGISLYSTTQSTNSANGIEHKQEAAHDNQLNFSKD